MTLGDAMLLAAAGLMGGLVNAVAGGGTFFTFSALVAVGLPAIPANATSAVATWPGYIASLTAYRKEIASHRRRFALLGAVSAVGGLLGAAILLRLEDAQFRVLVPWLLLGATLLFGFSPWITAALRKPGRPRARPVGKALALVVQFAVAIYGGFFGAGMGIMMLAALAITEGDDFHTINAAKALLSTLIGAVSVGLFVVSGIVRWQEASIVAATVIAGGYAGVIVAKKVPTVWIRTFVVVTGGVLSVYFFVRT